MKVRMVAGAFAAIAIVGVAAFFVKRAVFSGGGDAGPEPQRYGEVALEGVPPDDVANFHLSAPSNDYVPTISGSQALRIAKANAGKGKATQVLLAQREANDAGEASAQVWVVNFDPSGADVPFGCVSRIIYSLAFVEAETGELLSAPTKGAGVPGCKRYDIDTPDSNKTPDTPDAPPGISPEP